MTHEGVPPPAMAQRPATVGDQWVSKRWVEMRQSDGSVVDTWQRLPAGAGSQHAYRGIPLVASAGRPGQGGSCVPQQRAHTRVRPRATSRTPRRAGLGHRGPAARALTSTRAPYRGSRLSWFAPPALPAALWKLCNPHGCAPAMPSTSDGGWPNGPGKSNSPVAKEVGIGTRVGQTEF